MWHMWYAAAVVWNWLKGHEWLAICLGGIALVLIFLRNRKGTKVSVEDKIRRAEELSVSLESLLFEKQYRIRNNRDELCLLHWSLIFEHHQGLLLLLRQMFYAPAFALMRPIAETFLRLHVIMHGTEPQLESIRNGSYRTEFETIGKQIDEKLGVEPLMGPFFAKSTNILHGFTHGGPEQLRRRRNGADIVPTYSDEDVLDVVRFTTIFVFLTAQAVLDYLALDAEFKQALVIYDRFRKDD